MTIITEKQCPSCGQLIDRYHGRNPIVGPPIVKCPGCSKNVVTGYKLWGQLSNGEKLSCSLREIFFFPFDIIFSIGYKLLLLFLIYTVINELFEFKISELSGISENDILLGTVSLLGLHALYQKFKGYILLYRLKMPVTKDLPNLKE
ncbi:hypothetical protein [Pseudoalteromonas sp. APC 3691]|uniref:hypothetical protein n=1 Tax=Pseudoalteromonas sp. APC 3691 TaxID=3035173 RepID=UPI0025B42B5C|nr:hypothetical protein [Pseudoalteromonas sp. APC 3691]MDN3390152.1 hypothetical protein [Pseudoalteromonas sp. APC 3691]